ncbi:MAG TPA: helix-turn-helix domain-containing protein [Pseudonocardiaceae bacterium]|jgi:AcrR family transcriptional regulator|nr:helix-turn-helix domain-containing protein [Pseudonocardiaceae bacterium]
MPAQVNAPSRAPDRRALLVRAATELFGERAYDEVTTTEIARRAGVAYGLIAHHFTNKRGLYLATVRAGADRLRAMREAPPSGDTRAEQLHDVIDRYIGFVDRDAALFLSVMRGGQGSDPEVAEIVDRLRWESTENLLGAFGVTAPLPPLLRATTRGWIGYLDELIIDHLRHRDVPRAHLVELAAAALVAALRTATDLDPHPAFTPDTLDELAGLGGLTARR